MQISQSIKVSQRTISFHTIYNEGLGANKLARPVAGGSVLAGVLKSSVVNTTSGA